MPQNCYAFAIRYDEDVAIDPGELSGRRYKSTMPMDIVAAASRDGVKPIGGGHFGNHRPQVVPDPLPGTYLVALLTSTKDDSAYHWLRQRYDRGWEHKLGEHTLYNDAKEKRLDRDNPPHKANFNLEALYKKKSKFLHAIATKHGWVNYDTFLGYFSVPEDGLKKPDQKKCFITTATCQSVGLGRECKELEILRQYRDTVLAKEIGGVADIEFYYSVAPDIVVAIDNRNDAEELYHEAYHDYIQPAVQAIQAENYQLAYGLYRDMVRRFMEIAFGKREIGWPATPPTSARRMRYWVVGRHAAVEKLSSQSDTKRL